MLLNSKLVEDIGEVLVKSLDNIKNGSCVIEHDLGPELSIEFVRDFIDARWVINDRYFVSSVGSISISKSDTAKDIAEFLIQLAIEKADEVDKIKDMYNGITTNIEYDSVIGLTVKFHCDVDSRRLMVAQTANPSNVLYALEEAVNSEMSIDSQLMTSSHSLQVRTLTLFADYLLADLITHDVAI